MSFLDELRAKKTILKSTTTNITRVDGTQVQITLSKDGEEIQGVQKSQKSYGFIVDTKPDFVPACILKEFLYLGSQDAVTLDNVHKYQLSDILSIGIDTPSSDIDQSTIKTHFIECLDLPETQLESVIEQTNRIIKSVYHRNGRILVHCNAGVSRSSTVCIGYLMIEHKMSFESAYELVKSKRECIRPNDGFLKQLRQMGEIR